MTVKIVTEVRKGRRFAATAAGATMAAALLAGCGGESADSGDQQSDADGGTSGQLTIAWRSNDEETGRKVMEAYQEARPEVDVTLDIIPFQSEDFRQSLLTRRLGDGLPDVVQSIDRFTPLTADAGISVDMTPFLEAEGGVTADMFAEPFLNQYVIDGEVHGLPVTGDAVVLYYNKAHFDEAGIDYPDDTWTWQDMVDAAARLSETGTDRYGFVATYDWQAMYVPMLVAEGGEYLDENGHVQLDSPESVSAFTKLIEPVTEEVFAPQSVVEAQGGDPPAVFSSGTASMLAGVRGWLPGIRDSIESDFDVAPFPKINDTRANGMGSRSLFLTEAGMENSEASFDFLNWFYSEDGMEILTETYAVVPPIETLYDSPIWRDLPAPPENNQVFVDALETGVIVPPVPAAAQGTVDEAVTTAVDRVLLGDADIETALSDATETINAAIEEAQN